MLLKETNDAARCETHAESLAGWVGLAVEPLVILGPSDCGLGSAELWR
jgi:hypothetical protein